MSVGGVNKTITQRKTKLKTREKIILGVTIGEPTWKGILYIYLIVTQTSVILQMILLFVL